MHNTSDSFALTFSKKMSATTTGATIRVQDQDGTTATINCGAGATCTFDTTATTTVLTVTLTAPLAPDLTPSGGPTGTTPGLAIPFNITATTNIRDASGNVPNILGSPDRLVEYNTEAGG